MTDDAESAYDGITALLQSPRLRQRRFDTIPLRGPGAAATDVQGRLPGDLTTPAELSDLISSIAAVGVLQPVLAEEIQRDGAPPLLRLVTGERRLRACRWGAANLPDHPHFGSLPAIVCPGPLSAEERRIWQIVENLAREPLRPGEQAAALLLHRCAVLTGKLLRAGRPIPADVEALEDPVERWEALERIRGRDTACAAPWPEVLRRLGLQLSPRKARQLVSAFRALPRHICEEMDEEKVRLHTRIRFARLLSGRAQAAEEIWAAVHARKQTRLLAGAVHAALDDPGLSAEEAIGQAQQAHDSADQARSEALSRQDAGLPEELVQAIGEPGGEGAACDAGPAPAEAEPEAAAEPLRTTEFAWETEAPEADAAAALTALRDLCAVLRAGHRLSRYDRGSLRLLLDELVPLLDQGAES
jgi:ParB family chromosome partitioning protein